MLRHSRVLGWNLPLGVTIVMDGGLRIESLAYSHRNDPTLVDGGLLKVKQAAARCVDSIRMACACRVLQGVSTLKYEQCTARWTLRVNCQVEGAERVGAHDLGNGREREGKWGCPA